MKEKGIKKIILIYDSDFLSSQLIGRGIKKAVDARCIWTANEKHALNTVKTKSVDLLIVEADQAPGFNKDLIHTVKHQDGLEVPVIALSKNFTEAKRRKYEDLGVEAMFEKPFSPAEIWAKSYDLIKKRAFQLW